MRSVLIVALLIAVAPTARAQVPAHDPSPRLAEVLPDHVRARVLARIADARARALPARALEHRALEMIAKGASGAQVERAIDAQADAMLGARSALSQGRGRAPGADEVTAASEAMVRGVDGAQVSALAAGAPSGRSLTVPLHVLAGLVSRGLPADDAVAQVRARLLARTTDEQLVSDLAKAGPPAHAGGRPPMIGTALAGTLRPGRAGQPAPQARPPRGGPPITPP